MLQARVDFPRHFDVKAKDCALQSLLCQSSHEDLVRRLLTDRTKRFGCLKSLPRVLLMVATLFKPGLASRTSKGTNGTRCSLHGETSTDYRNVVEPVLAFAGIRLGRAACEKCTGLGCNGAAQTGCQSYQYFLDAFLSSKYL